MSAKMFLALPLAFSVPYAASAQVTADPFTTGETTNVLDATNSAIATCFGFATGTARPAIDAEIYTDVAIASLKQISALPDRVKRLIARNPMGRTADTVLRFRSSEGQIWVVPTDFGCEISLMDLNNADLETKIISAFSESAGWRTLAEVRRSAEVPLAQYIFLKRLPTTSKPMYAARAKIQSVGTSDPTPDGIQMSISFLAGDVQPQDAPDREASTIR